MVDQEDVEKHSTFWTGLEGTVVTMQKKVDELWMSGLPSTASGTVLAYSTSVQPKVFSIDINTSSTVVAGAIKEFRAFIENPDLADEVRDFLYRLDLDVARTGKVSPPSMFNDAFSVSEGNASAVKTLIPMRSSLTECIYILLDQRASHKRVPSWEDKLRSICNQLAYASVLPFTVDNLVTDLEDLIDELSPAKTDQLERPELRDRIYRAIRFYHALLGSIDQSKLRKPPKT